MLRKFAGIALLAFVLRAAVGLLLANGVPALDIPPRDWRESGYSHYATIARTLIQTGEYRLGPILAPRPPLYPGLLAALLGAFGESGVAPVLVQAMLGAGTVCVTALIAQRVFDVRTGLLAGVIAAVYPYWVVHDTALQETALFTLLTAAAVERLLAAQGSRSLLPAAVAGLLFGFAVLCRESILPFVPVAALWLVAAMSPAPRTGRRLLSAAILLGAAALVVAPWIARNKARLGTPVVTTGTGFGLGYRLWVANNPWTLTAYPRRSIDIATARAFSALDETDSESLRTLDPNKTDSWFLAKAVSFVREDPTRFFRAGLTKVAAGLGPLLSPRRGPLPDLLYTLSWVPLALAAGVGFWATRRSPFALLVLALFTVFALSTFVLHAHTSHRVWLDVYVITLAASTLVRAKIHGSKRISAAELP